MNLRLSWWLRRCTNFFFGVVQVMLFSVVTSLVIFRLGNMQLDGLAGASIAFLALLFGFTSLMYNRARTYPRGPIQRRTVFAAELSLRATLSFTVAVAIGGAIFAFLQDGGYPPTPVNKLPTRPVPLLLAFLPTSFLVYTFFKLFAAVRIVLHHAEIPTSAVKVARRL